MNELQIIWAIVGTLTLFGGILLTVRVTSAPCTWTEVWSITSGIFSVWIIVSVLMAGYVMGILWLGQWHR